MFLRFISSTLRNHVLPVLLLLTLLASLVVPPGAAQAAAVNVIDINSNAMSLSGGTVTSGTAGALNAVYSYSNVITIGGITVSAKVTITESNGATLDQMDDDSTFSSRLNPIVTTSSGTGSATLKVEFFNQQTGDPVALKNFFVTVIDIDGSSSTKKEFVELSGFASYTTNNPTGLTIGPGSNGRTQFEGISTSLSGITFEDTAAFIANYTAPISSMNVVIGNKGTLSGRQFSINFGAIAVTDQFTTPKTTTNANAPTLTVAIDDGGDGKVESGAEIASTPIGGTTNAGPGQTVLLEVSDGAGHVGQYSAVVAGDGSYTVNADLSGFNYGTITVKADVVNSQGNPAPTATDTTLKSNLAPTATGGSQSTNEDTAVSGSLIGGDGNGDPITFAIDTMPAHGTVVITDMTTGAYTYTPSPDYNGSDSFTFTVNDGALTSSPATVNITVLPMNDPPTAAGSSETTLENTALSAAVSGTDVDGDTLTYAVSTLPAHGTLLLNDDGTYTYTPAANYYGSDSFAFTVSDGSVTSSPATVGLTITHVNHAPVTADSSETTAEDTPVSGTATASDSDSDPLTYAVVAQPQHGTVAWGAGGSYTYTPASNYNGSDSFTFKVNDGTVDSNTSTVSLTITADNDAPTVNDASATTAEDTPLSAAVSGSDVEGSTLTYTVVTPPEHGAIVLNADGTYTYTPDANYHGPDSFTFKANDDSLDSAPGTVTLTVTSVNDPPVVGDSSETTAEDAPFSGSVTASDADNDALTYTVVTQPQHGTVVLNADGTYTYTPNANYNGTDSFVFKTNDGTVDSTNATVTLTITADNDAPTVSDASATTAEDTPLSAAVSGSDVEGSTLTYTVVTPPEHGMVTLNADGTYTYTPDANYHGPDSFTFKANDGSLDSAPGTVTLTVTSVNDPPVVGDSSETTAEDTPFSGSVTASDADNDALTYTVVTQPQHGTVVLNADGTYTYTPNANYNGTDSFVFKTNDGMVDSANATVTLTITADNDAPTVNDASETTAEDTPLSAAVSGSDVEGSTLTYTVVTSPEHGTVTLNADGTYTYTPDANYHGPDSFTFKANDGSLDSAPGTVTLTVTSVNDPPVADAATVALEANTTKQGTLTGQDVDGDPLTFIPVTLPAHGTLVVNPNGTYSYTPNSDYGGSDSFTFKVNDGHVDSPAVTVSLTVELLEGWTGSRDVSVTTPEWVVAPDKPLKLSAQTSMTAVEVKAVMDFDGPDSDSANDEISLSWVNPDTYLTDGYKKWENVTYRLPADVTAGSHMAAFAAADANGPLSAEPAGKLLNNHYTVVKYIDLDGIIADRDTQQPIPGAQVTLYDPTGKQVVGGPVTTDASGHYSFPHVRTEQYSLVVKKDTYASRSRAVDALPTDAANTVIHQDFELVRYLLTLTANPSSLVGDGVTKSLLTAVLTDMDGHPLAGVPIAFTAPLGTFVGSSTAVTDANGQATIQYQSAKIEGILSQQIPVTATAEDVGRAIYAQEQIIVTFEPASVSGIVATTTDGVRTVVPGTKVKVTKDFDHDGIIDFAAEAVTDADGKYSLAVPRGDVQYDVEVIKTVTVGNQTKEVSFKQTADVGAVTGAGGEVFDSTKTATGVLVTQLPGGQKKLMDENNTDDQQFAAQVRVKLRDPVTKSFVTVGGQTSFPLSADGVFNIPGLGLNQEYELAIVYAVPDAANHGPDQEIIVNALDNQGTLPKIKVASNGEMNILDELIDPYGDVTDFNTHAALDGATLKLYYANTTRNITNGVVPNTEVVLPLIPGFAPNNNANPQTSRDGGKYAYMVYPTTDYYLIVTAPGYNTYTSPVIPVEFTIVRHDVIMKKSGDAAAGGPVGPVGPLAPAASGEEKPNVTVNVSIERSKQAESTIGTVKVAYLNDGTATAAGATVTLTVPQGAVVTDADGGTVEGNTITWQVGDLAVMNGGAFKVTLRYPAIGQAEAPATLAATGQAGTQGLLDSASAQASAQMMLFSNRFGELSHTRYILGYPDELFHPLNNLTRAELAAIVARLQTGGATTLKAQFSDVPATHWASGYIRIAADSGLFDGFNDGTFRPDTPVTREELAVVMTRFLKLDVSTPIQPHFYDAQGRWSTAAIEALYRSGLVSGYEDGSFKPSSAITRLEAVTMINSLLFRGPLTNVEPSFPDVDATNWAFGQVEEATRSHQATRGTDGAERFIHELDDDVN